MTEAQNIKEICKILLEDLQEGRINEFKLAQALGNISGMAQSYIDQEEREEAEMLAHDAYLTRLELKTAWHKEFMLDKHQLAQRND